MRTQVVPRHSRRVLCVFPAYAPAFGTFSYALKLVGAKAFMPPQGLLLVANYLPKSWPVRFIDENIAKASAADMAWADVVMVTGMHIQSARIRDIARRARAAGKVSVLGGPAVSAAPERFAEFDYLHIGELGDSTDRLIECLDESIERPSQQIRFQCERRLSLGQFPLPAYDKARLAKYLIGTLQFSSGCPYLCEFCDIPSLYGRQPRYKSPEQIIRELDFILQQDGYPPSIYFVDDNFIGNRKAVREMLPHLVAWQQRHNYPLTFACEATLNIARQRDILGLMREARFETIFVGIESPELGALRAMHKEHNASLPMLEAIETINSFGMEVVCGIILGLDSDTSETERNLRDFIDRSKVPMLTINLLQALPKTALWARLERDGRIVDDAERESNVRFLRPHDEVVAGWRRSIAYAYEPSHLVERFIHQLRVTFPNRLPTDGRGQLNLANVRRGLRLLFNLAFRVGLAADYRAEFWRLVRLARQQRRLDWALSAGFVAYHLIEFTREALRGTQNASFYSGRERQRIAEEDEVLQSA